MKRIYDLWYSVKDRFRPDAGSDFVLALMKDCELPIENAAVQARYEQLLLNLHELIRKRGLVPDFWLQSEEVSTAEIEAKVLDLVDLVKPRVEERAVDEEFVTVSALGFLLLLAPQEHAFDYDPSLWRITGQVGDVEVYDIGGVLVEFLAHRWFLRRIDIVKAFSYYELALAQARTLVERGMDVEHMQSAFGLLLVGHMIKFSENLQLLTDFPWVSELIDVATNALTDASALTEFELMKRASEITNELAIRIASTSSLLSGAVAALSAIESGIGRPIVAATKRAHGLLKADGSVLTGEQIARANHTHPELLSRSQPAVDALYLVEYEDGLKRRYTSSDFAMADHTHFEYATVDDLQNADYLYDGTRFYQASDFAAASHEHSEYLAAGQPVLGAKKFVNEVFGEALVPISHEQLHDDVYLKQDEPALASYKLAGEYADNFALANHRHSEYITQAEASAKGELLTEPNVVEKGVKGLYTVIDQPGTTNDIAVAVHYKVFTVSFAGSYTINVPNVIFCHVTLVGPTTKASLPSVEYQVDVLTGRRTGVVLRTLSSEPTTVQVLLGYVPDVRNLVGHGLVPSSQVYKVE